MGDSMTMTIEFLRARLLSERSVSRSARQRADQLAKRVVELEEQLRIVTIQRKKAEKAATEVLVILETQGIGDFPEGIDSSSDRDEVPGGVKGSDDNTKEDDTSTTSRMDRSEVDDGLSGSEIEVPPSQGRSLSWKSRSSSQDSLENEKVNQARQRCRRNSFVSTVGSSPKHHLGKSCRKIKQKEMGSAAEHGKRGATPAEDISDCLDDITQVSKTVHENEEEKLEGTVSSSHEDQSIEPDAGLYANGSDRHGEMERALQQQAQLIGRYQAEENAQREWEEKYNENNSSALDSCEQLGKHPDITEKSNAVEEAAKLADETLCHGEDANTRTENIEEPTTQTHSNVIVPTDQTFQGALAEKSANSKNATAATFSDDSAPADVNTCSVRALSVDTDGWMLQQCNRTAANGSETGLQEFEFPGPLSSGTKTNGKQDQELSNGNSDISSHSNSSLQPHVDGFLDSMSTDSPSSAWSSGKFSKGQWSDMQKQLHRVLPEAPNSGLGSVLEALQRAKLSLRQELDRMPPPTPTLQSQGARATTTDSQALAVRASGTLDIAIGSAALFRLPTDVSPQTDFSRPLYHGQELSVPTHRSDAVFPASAGRDRYPVNPYMETGSRGPAGRQYLDPYVNPGMGMPASSASRYSYPSSTDLTVRNTSYDRFPNPYSEMKSEMLPRR